MNPGRRWGDLVAAFWAIAWPASALSWLVILAPVALVSDLTKSATWGPLVAFATPLVYLAALLYFTPRLTRKDFRDFRLRVVRDNGLTDRRLSRSEALRVWLCLVGTQIAIACAVVALAYWFGATKGLNGLKALLRYLVVGPIAVRIALQTKYQGFRLEAVRPETGPETGTA